MMLATLFAILVALLAAYISTQTVQRAQDTHGGQIAEPGSGAFFDTIADRYDLLNRVISLGHDAQWRRSALRAVTPAASVLDVSTGTGDLAIAVAAASDARVVGIDPSAGMLARGREKIALLGKLGNVELVEGVAESLPFGSGEFEAVVVAFGVRNFQDREKGLREMTRVLKPGGRMAVLELSMPQGDGVLQVVARFFVNKLMPRVAALVTGNPGAYRYLSESMQAFPNAERFAEMLSEAGLHQVSHERLAPFGLGPDLYTAYKPKGESVAEGSEHAGEA